LISVALGFILDKLVLPVVTSTVKKIASAVYSRIRDKIKQKSFEKDLVRAVDKGNIEEFMGKYEDLLTDREKEQLRKILELKDTAKMACRSVEYSVFSEETAEVIEKLSNLILDAALKLDVVEIPKLQIVDKDTGERVTLSDLNQIQGFLHLLAGVIYTHIGKDKTPGREGIALDQHVEFTVKFEVAKKRIIAPAPPEMMLEKVSIVERIFDTEYLELETVCNEVIEAYKRGKEIYDMYMKGVKHFTEALKYVEKAGTPEYSKIKPENLRVFAEIFENEAYYWLITQMSESCEKLEKLREMDKVKLENYLRELEEDKVNELKAASQQCYVLPEKLTQTIRKYEVLEADSAVASEIRQIIVERKMDLQALKV